MQYSTFCRPTYVVRDGRIELPLHAWEARVLPLHKSRMGMNLHYTTAPLFFLQQIRTRLHPAFLIRISFEAQPPFQAEYSTRAANA